MLLVCMMHAYTIPKISMQCSTDKQWPHTNETDKKRSLVAKKPNHVSQKKWGRSLPRPHPHHLLSCWCRHPPTLHSAPLLPSVYPCCIARIEQMDVSILSAWFDGVSFAWAGWLIAVVLVAPSWDFSVAKYPSKHTSSLLCLSHKNQMLVTQNISLASFPL